MELTLREGGGGREDLVGTMPSLWDLGHVPRVTLWES